MNKYDIKINDPETLDKSMCKENLVNLKTDDFVNDDFTDSESNVWSSLKLSKLMPHDMSELNNDSEYITDLYEEKLYLDENFSMAASKEDIVTKEEFNKLVAGLSVMKIVIMDELPIIGKADTIYAVPHDPSEENNLYDEFIWEDDKWEKLYKDGITLIDAYTMSELGIKVKSLISDSDTALNKTWSSEQTRIAIETFIDTMDIDNLNKPRQIIYAGDTTVNYWTFDDIETNLGVSATLRDYCVFIPGGESDDNKYNDIFYFNRFLTGWRIGDVLPHNFVGGYKSVKAPVDKFKNKLILCGGGWLRNGYNNTGITIANDLTVTPFETSMLPYSFSTIGATKNLAVFAGGYDNINGRDIKDIFYYDFETNTETTVTNGLTDYHTNGTGVQFNNDLLIIGGYTNSAGDNPNPESVKSIEVFSDDGTLTYYDNLLLNNNSTSGFPPLACILNKHLMVTGYGPNNKLVDIIDKDFTHSATLELYTTCSKGSIDVMRNEIAVIAFGETTNTRYSNVIQTIDKDFTVTLQEDAMSKLFGRNSHLSATIGESLYYTAGNCTRSDKGIVSLLRYDTVTDDSGNGGSGSGGGSSTPSTDGTVTEFYSLDVQKDLTRFGAGTKSDGDVEYAGTDSYFALYYSTKSKIDSSTKTFSDGFTSELRVNFQGPININEPITNCIGITTNYPAVVKVWWVEPGENSDRQVNILNSRGTLVAESNNTVEKNKPAISELELPEAGTYYIGGNLNIYIFKVEVSETYKGGS